MHGDLKPANILIGEGGVRTIDSLQLKPGDQSTAMTPSWAAPEQLLGACVLSATDQYALGSLICVLVGPVAQRVFLRRFGSGPVLTEFDDTRIAAELDSAGLKAWCRFLDRCLQFDPASRFPTMADLAGELRATLNRHPVPGDLALFPNFGRVQLSDLGEPFWVAETYW